MKIHAKRAVVAGVMALWALPAVALGAAGGHPNQPTTHKTGTKAKADGPKKLLRQQAGG